MFPYATPFPQQVEVMDAVKRAAAEGTCAAIESPTGTGKTLALLCAAVEWQRGLVGEKRSKGSAKIFYASRTHTQLQQVVKEAKRCFKGIKSVVLASKDHYCIRPENAGLKGTAKNDACGKAIREATCEYYALTRCNEVATAVPWTTPDIEDLVKAGKKLRACPYYAAKISLETADVVFLPYSYILDPVIRGVMGVDEHLDGALVIIDEAHNVEDTARDAASFDRSLPVLESHVIAFRAAPKCPTETAILERFLDKIAEWTRSQQVSRDTDAKVRLGKETLEEWKIDAAEVSSLQIACERVKRVNDALEFMPTAPVACASALLQSLWFAVRWPVEFRFAATFTETVEFHSWCMSPAPAFSLLRSKVGTVALVSGTLAPFDALESELECRFPVRVETTHVIDVATRLFCRSVTRGAITQEPTAEIVPLDSTFKNANNGAYYDALGETLLSCAARVPNGALCFFQSYTQLERAALRWKHTKLWVRLSRRKPIFVEVRGKEFDIGAYRSCATSPSGALLLGVMRGKLSEGIDFPDAAARAVFVVGVPFPSVFDTLINLKKEHQDAKVKLPLEDGRPSPLSGNAWYERQAFRAVNQAIGRVIRHREDYGAVLLLEQRFARLDVRGKLSKWMRDEVRSEITLNELDEFFKKF